MSEIETLFSELDSHVNHGDKWKALEVIDVILQQDGLTGEDQNRVHRIFELIKA